MLLYPLLLFWALGIAFTIWATRRGGEMSALGVFIFTGLIGGALIGNLTGVAGVGAGFGGGLGLWLGAGFDWWRARQRRITAPEGASESGSEPGPEAGIGAGDQSSARQGGGGRAR
ncbi:hypothetical protein CCR80_03365 [Rhodothalassium salexigens]|nr:hypothetical protein [Rhodothalassium salexigens]